MNKEFIKMQKLAGLITESEYKGKLNETQSIEEFVDALIYMAVENNIITTEQAGQDDIINAAVETWEQMGFGEYEETGQGISTSDYNRALQTFSTLMDIND